MSLIVSLVSVGSAIFVTLFSLWMIKQLFTNN